MTLDTAPAVATPHVRPADVGHTPPAAGRANDTVIAAIRAHHAQLAEQLHRGTEAVLLAARSGDALRERDTLHDWYRAELLPHAVAEERVLYGPGEGLPVTRLLVRGMIAEHRRLEGLIADLGKATSPVDIAAIAAATRSVFTVHLAKENDLLLPALDEDGLDLGAILDGMHEILGHATEAESDGGCGCGCGHDHEAPPLLISDVQEASSDALDVRTLPHAERHEIIFSRLDELQPGAALVILNDHDPKPLRYQTSALFPDRFEWTYEESGPERWRVAITRVG